MSFRLQILSGGVTLLLLTGCVASHEGYAWGSYDRSLYAYYKAPAKADDFAMSLAAVVKGADQTHAIVAPGIYAEYGYLMMQQGKMQEAIKAFQSEAKQWPESRVFMERMIKLAAAEPKPATEPQPAAKPEPAAKLEPSP